MPALVDIVQGNALTWGQGSQSTPTARTATADGLTTGIIAPGTSVVSVTSANATYLVTLPPPVAGNSLVVSVGANGFRLQTSDPATIGINAATPGGGTYMQIPAQSTAFIFYQSATNFTVFIFSNAGALDTGIEGYLNQSVSPRLIHTGGMPARVNTDGTDATPVATEVYIAQIFIDANCTITGVANFNGSVVSGNIKVGLADSAGNIVATSASTVMSGVDSYQRVPFTSTYAAKGPATFYVLLFVDNGTARINCHTFGDFGAGKQTGQVFATGFTTITPPTTFTTGLGPIASLY